VLDITNNGVTVVEDPSQGPYDGSDDTLVGVINESSTPVTSLTLNSNTPIFEFDGDGICSGFYGTIPGCPFGPTGYEGPGAQYVDISPDFTSGAVEFSTGLPPGATGYFSLEAPLTASSILPTHYVALGDSVAAGEGIGYGWTWNSSTKRWEGGSSSGVWDETYEPAECHQTTEGYPHVLADEVGARLEDFACTGASAFNGVLNERTDASGWSAPAQLGSSIGLPGSAPPNPSYDATEPELLTLTLGADDVHFSDLVEECYKTSCSTDQHRLDKVLGEQERNLKLVLEEIHRRGVADGRVPLVVATGYYSPFPSYDPSCVDLNFRVGPLLGAFHFVLDDAEMQFLKKGEQRLNANIAKVATAEKVFVLSTDGLFKGHRWCSTEPWVYGPSIESLLHHDSNAPFHPTPEGQEAIGRALSALTASRLPVNTGSSVHVGLPGGSLDFSDVATAGEASIVPADDLLSGLPSPSTFALTAAYEITASAVYEGPITVSLPSTVPLTLFHYVEGAWHEVPSTFNGSAVSGEVETLSPFALGTPVSPVHARLAAVAGGEAPAAAHFDASASSVDDASGIVEYAWDFGDGTEETTIEPFVSHTYTQAGTYEATVTVKAADGAVDQTSQEVIVTHTPPTAEASGPATGTVGEELAFTSAGSTTSGGPYEAVWEWGDGTEAAGAAARHTFSAAGEHNVTLTVQDDEGETATATIPVTISARPLTETITPPEGGVSPPTAAGGVRGTQSSTVPALSIEPRVRWAKGGKLLVRLRCATGTLACTGTLLVKSRVHGKSAVVGSIPYTLDAGKAAWVGVRMAKPLARVATRRHVKLVLLALETGGTNSSRTVQAPLRHP
jgi:PKD repeat protein